MGSFLKVCPYAQQVKAGDNITFTCNYRNRSDGAYNPTMYAHTENGVSKVQYLSHLCTNQKDDVPTFTYIPCCCEMIVDNEVSNNDKSS